MGNDLIGKLLAASEGFLVPLRMRDGFDEDAFSRLCEALRKCQEEWRTQDWIPKRAVSILVDLFSLTLGCVDSYTGATAERVRRAAYDLDILVTASVAQAENDGGN